MLIEVIKITIISLMLIFLIHYLYYFLLQSFTRPNIADLVEKPKKDYEKIFNTINSDNLKKTNDNKITNNNINNNINNNNNNDNDSINNENVNLNSDDSIKLNIASSDMKNELKHFISKEMTTDNTINFNSMQKDNLEFSSF